MALDKVVDSAVLDAGMMSVADAIRAKAGTTDPLAWPDGFKAAVEGIQTGSGGGSTSTAAMKDVNFYDYDGTLVASYTLAEAQALTALPDGPTHDGLTFQGWNWSLESIKALNREVTVGAMYITDDGKTRLHIRIWDTVRSNVPLYISQTVANGVTIDWGDGSETETLSGTGNVNTTHQYTEVGDYTIALDPAEGCTLGFGHNINGYCVFGTTTNYSKVYTNLLQDVQIGSNVTKISNYAFRYFSSLASVTIPAGVSAIGTYALSYCYSLKSITIPDSVTRINNYAFQNCSSLASVTIPAGVSAIGTYAFTTCYSLASVIVPDNVTSIGASAFSMCCAIASVIIPDSVTSIGAEAFKNCNGVAEFHLLPTSPPTLSDTNAFNGIPSDCIIYVPKGCLESYQNETNWATYASYMQEEPA